MTVDNRIDSTVAHPARRYDYWLGGKDNFAADRASGDALAEAYPPIRTTVRKNREFLQCAVRFLAGEAGVRQFLDIGTGLPTANNTHEVAQRIAPQSRIVYVDNDPLVLAHARALLTSTSEGRTAYAEADLGSPDTILSAPELRSTLNLGEPVALLLLAVLHFLEDDAVALHAVHRLMAALAPGSFLVISHAASDLLGEDSRERVESMFGPGSEHGLFRMRDRQQISAFVGGMQLVDPGLVPLQNWRPDPGANHLPDEEVSMYAVVARK